MNRRPLGRTGLQVSEVGFGCWAIGGTSYGPTRDEESLEALQAAWEKGVNFFDTADTYGHGHSETLVGRFLKGKPRDEIVIATKVGWDFYHGGSRKNFDPAYIRFACDESLKRLGIDAIDVYQLHNPSLALIQKGECLEVLADLKRQGKIRFAGVSIHGEEEGLQAIRDGRADCLQLVFNVIEQDMAGRVFGEARRARVGIIAREPLACGVLTGKYTAEHVFTKNDHRHGWPREKFEADLEKVEAIRRTLATGRLSLVRASLEYVLGFKEVSTVIPGAKTRAQVDENVLASLDPRLRSQEASQLRDLMVHKGR